MQQNHQWLEVAPGHFPRANKVKEGAWQFEGQIRAGRNSNWGGRRNILAVAVHPRSCGLFQFGSTPGVSSDLYQQKICLSSKESHWWPRGRQVKIFVFTVLGHLVAPFLYVAHAPATRACREYTRAVQGQGRRLCHDILYAKDHFNSSNSYIATYACQVGKKERNI